jgi:uncharacterized membrane protein YccC
MISLTPMPDALSNARQWLIAAMVGLTAAIFLLDLVTPVGVTLGMLYVAPIYLATWLPHRRMIFVVAGACTVLTVLSYFFSPPGGVPWIVLTNHGLAIIAIWMTAFIAWLHRRMETVIKTLRRLLPICDSCKQIRDERGSWRRLESYVAQHVQAEFTHGICPTCERRYYEELVSRRASG